MKIVITGASGFVGRALVPELAGVELLLVGRDPERLARMFPDHSTCDYAALARKAAGFDLVVHLAVANNDPGLDESVFQAVNVDFLLDVARAVRGCTLVNVSSIHALDLKNDSAYARSKRAGADRLAQESGITVHTLFLPMVYGDDWTGKLGFLNKLPRMLARGLFQALAALKPTVHSTKIAAWLQHDAQGETSPWTILSDDQSRNVFFAWGKRILDLLFVFSIIVLLWWALLIIWIVIRATSPGPGIFAQTRVGLNEKPFTCYKFRTMQQDTKQAGSHEVSAASVTRVGSFLRASKLDEMPQIWNVLCNQVSLVGPRPSLPVQDKVVSERRKCGVFAVKPGITGLAQINDIDMSMPEALAQKDAEYIALRSLLSEIRIILGTFLGRGRGDRVGR